MHVLRLTALMAAHQAARIAAQDSTSADAPATIPGLLHPLGKRAITVGYALRLLGYHPLLATAEPTRTTLC